MLEALHDSGSLDQKGLKSLESGVERVAIEAPTVSELLAVRVENDGHSGATMMKNESLRRLVLDHERVCRAHAFAPDIVIITLGTNDNDIYDWDHHDQFAGDYAAMIDDFRALASHPDVTLAYRPGSEPTYPRCI